MSDPSNSLNVIYMLCLLLGVGSVAFLVGDLIAYARMMLSSWPPSLDYDRLNHEARQALAEARGDSTRAVEILRRRTRLSKQTLDTLISLQK